MRRKISYKIEIFFCATILLFGVFGAFASSIIVNDNALGSGLNQFNFSGKWTFEQDGRLYGGDQYWSGDVSLGGKNNAYFTLQFSGTKIELYCKKNHANGVGAVSIDGGVEVDVDYSSQNEVFQSLVYTSPGLVNGVHTLKMRMTGRTLGYPARESFLTTDYAKIYDDVFPIDPLPTAKVDQPRNAYEKIEAENTNNYYLLTVSQDCNDVGGTKKIAWVETNGAWAGYYVDFGTGATGVDLRVTTENSSGGTIKIRKGTYDGTVLGSVTIPGGKGWADYTGTIDKITGKDTVYLTFEGAGTWPHFDMNWFKFTGGSLTTKIKSPTLVGEKKSSITPVFTRTHAFNAGSSQMIVINRDQNFFSIQGIQIKNSSSIVKGHSNAF